MSTEELPEPHPVAVVIEEFRKHSGIPVREAARRARISESRWRQIALGYQQMAGGIKAPVNAPPATLARMAQALGIYSEQLSQRLRAFIDSDNEIKNVVDILEKEQGSEALARGSVFGHPKSTWEHLLEVERWVETLQSRVHVLENEIALLKEGKADKRPYSPMSEADVKNYGLAAKMEDEHIGPNEIPNEP